MRETTYTCDICGKIVYPSSRDCYARVSINTVPLDLANPDQSCYENNSKHRLQFIDTCGECQYKIYSLIRDMKNESKKK